MKYKAISLSIDMYRIEIANVQKWTMDLITDNLNTISLHFYPNSFVIDCP
jgi:hypothetical protein